MDQQSSQTALEEFFVRRPYRNFFQYPPIQRQLEEPVAPADLLSRQVVAPETQYTVFVSVPYCRVRCNSCPYFVSLLPGKADQDALLDKYVIRLEQHLEHFSSSGHFDDRECRAIYIGGGTASLLSASQVQRVLTSLADSLTFAPNIEITLEGNPHEFNDTYLNLVRAAGVNRVSIGYQSSQEEVLRDMLNSPHSANESLSALKSALNAGFHTVNVDLLYRLPGQTFAQWRHDVETVIKLGPTSITTYEYIIHDRTVSARRIADGRMKAPTSGSEARLWYEWMQGRMRAEGYIEPTNHTFAKPGHKQNYSDLTYGKGTELIGLGVKAYSYINGYQLIAPTTVPKYEKAIDSGHFPVERISREPSQRNLMERYVIFSLRRGFGVSKEAFHDRFGALVEEEFRPQLDNLIENGTLKETSERIELTSLGKDWKYNVLEAFYDRELL